MTSWRSWIVCARDWMCATWGRRGSFHSTMTVRRIADKESNYLGHRGRNLCGHQLQLVWEAERGEMLRSAERPRTENHTTMVAHERSGSLRTEARRRKDARRQSFLCRIGARHRDSRAPNRLERYGCRFRA